MIIVMCKNATKNQSNAIIKDLEKQKFQPMPLYGIERTVIAIIGEERNLNMGHLESLPGVEKVMRVLKPYRLVSRETKHEGTIIKVNNVKIGDTKTLAIIGGPCSIESEEQMEKIAKFLSEKGIKIIRG